MKKELFDRKRENAAQKMLDNAKIESLTPEQHEALAWICERRHYFHTSDLFNSESIAAEELGRFYLEYPARLNEVGLPDMNLPGIEDWPNDLDEEEDAFEVYEEIKNDFNNAIERYLRGIDNEHGTSYCPTGITRFF